MLDAKFVTDRRQKTDGTWMKQLQYYIRYYNKLQYNKYRTVNQNSIKYNIIIYNPIQYGTFKYYDNEKIICISIKHVVIIVTYTIIYIQRKKYEKVQYLSLIMFLSLHKLYCLNHPHGILLSLI